MKLPKSEKIKLPHGMKLGKFKPVAYHDKDRDCICILLEDESITEVDINDQITLHIKNHEEGPDKVVGVTVHGIEQLVT